jgi:hypothetical protein
MQEGWSEKYKKSIDCKTPKGFSQRAHCQGRKKKVNEDLRDWFGKSKSKDGKPGWVQADGSPCANEPEDKGKTPKCFSSQRLTSLKAQGKKGEAKIRSAVRRKRDEDKGQQRKSGGAKPTMVRTFKDKEDYKKHPSGDRSESVQYEGKMEKDHEVSMAQSQLSNVEKDVKKLKKSLGKKEKNLPAWMQAKITDTEHNMDAASSYSEEKGPCWTGYKQVGMKKKGGKMVPNCVPVSKEERSPIVQKVLERIECEKEWELITEKNVPTNPSLWSKMKSRAKAKFDVYPSAYANGWAAKEYKKAGGGWKTVSEDTNCPVCGFDPCQCLEGTIEEAVKIPYQRGNIYLVSFMWRGKLMMMKVFFPEVKKPTRVEVQDALNKIYPGATVKRYDVTPFVQGDSYLNIGGDDYKSMVENFDQIDEVHRPPAGWKSYGGYEKEPVEVDATAKRIDNIRKSIKIKKEVSEESKGEERYCPKCKKMETKSECSYGPEYWEKNAKKQTNESAAWTRKAGKNKEGGLNEKGRKSYEKENPGSDLKAPSKKVGNPRRASFCARMKGMKKKLTSSKTANDPNSRINKSLRAWNC